MGCDVGPARGVRTDGLEHAYFVGPSPFWGRVAWAWCHARLGVERVGAGAAGLVDVDGLGRERPVLVPDRVLGTVPLLDELVGFAGTRFVDVPLGCTGARRGDDDELLGVRVEVLPEGRSVPRDPEALEGRLVGVLLRVVVGLVDGRVPEEERVPDEERVPVEERVPEDRVVLRLVDFVDLSPFFLSPERV